MQTLDFVCSVCTNESMDQWTYAPMGAGHQAGSILRICYFLYPEVPEICHVELSPINKYQSILLYGAKLLVITCKSRQDSIHCKFAITNLPNCSTCLLTMMTSSKISNEPLMIMKHILLATRAIERVFDLQQGP